MTCNLFRVMLTQTYTAEQHVLVYARDQNAAESAALEEAEFSNFDANECGGPDARVIPIQPDDIPRRTADQFSFCLVPPPPEAGRWWQEIDFKDLIAMISPADIEAARLAAIEANNGQLPLIPEATP